MSRRKCRDDPRQFEFNFTNHLQQPCIFDMTRKELLDYLPKAPKIWLFAVIIAMFDELGL